MFDVGGAELLIIALVAVIVLGPERLPKAARFAGLWVRRARAQWYSVKAELERELAQEDLKRQFTEPLAQMRPAIESLRQDLKRDFDSLDPNLPARVDLAPGEAPPAEAAPVIAEAVADAAPTLSTAADAPAMPDEAEASPPPADEPTTGDLFGGAPRP